MAEERLRQEANTAELMLRKKNQKSVWEEKKT